MTQEVLAVTFLVLSGLYIFFRLSVALSPAKRGGCCSCGCGDKKDARGGS
jgi:hypothetical protein